MKKKQKKLYYKPYNDFWFETCFYHGLAQIIGSLGAIDSLLLDEIFSYESIKENNLPVLIMKKEYFKGWVECLKNRGIYTNFVKIEPDALIKNIKISISMEYPVIIPIDCFYESLHFDNYMKRHDIHNLVIIGYDDERNIFNVLEHNYINDLNYKEQEISYSETEESYKGFMINYNNGNISEYIEINPKNFNQNEINNEKSINNINIILDTFINSFNHFDIFIKEFENVFTFENISVSIINFYGIIFNELLKLKRVQFAQIKVICLFYNLSENDLYLRIINNWTIIKRLIDKMIFMNKLPEYIIIKIVFLLKEVNKDEKLLFENIKNNISERCICK